MRPRQRLARLHPGLPPQPSRLSGRWTSVLLPVTVGAAVAVVAGGPTAPVWGVGAGLTVRYLLRDRRRHRDRRETAVAGAQLPFALDLITACLRSGAPLPHAIDTVGTALSGPAGTRLCATARALALGAAPQRAFAELGDLPGASRVRAAAVRSMATGAPLAAGFTQLAAELRDEQEQAAQAAAQRAAVAVVLPLCLCFLPAFVAAGLVPVVVTVLGDVLYVNQ